MNSTSTVLWEPGRATAPATRHACEGAPRTLCCSLDRDAQAVRVPEPVERVLLQVQGADHGRGIRDLLLVADHPAPLAHPLHPARVQEWSRRRSGCAVATVLLSKQPRHRAEPARPGAARYGSAGFATLKHPTDASERPERPISSSCYASAGFGTLRTYPGTYRRENG